MNAALDLQAFLEVDDMRRLALDGRDQFPALDDLQIVEAEPVAGAGMKRSYGLW